MKKNIFVILLQVCALQVHENSLVLGDLTNLVINIGPAQAIGSPAIVSTTVTSAFSNTNARIKFNTVLFKTVEITSSDIQVTGSSSEYDARVFVQYVVVTENTQVQVLVNFSKLEPGDDDLVIRIEDTAEGVSKETTLNVSACSPIPNTIPVLQSSCTYNHYNCPTTFNCDNNPDSFVASCNSNVTWTDIQTCTPDLRGKWNTYGLYYYYVSPGGVSKSFNDSQTYCNEQGGELALVKTQEVQEFIQTLVADGSGIPYGFYMGLRDINANGIFSWSDGEALNYSNWNMGEPNNTGSETCVVAGNIDTYDSNLPWFSDVCVNGTSGPKGFICQRPEPSPTTTTEPTTTPTPPGCSMECPEMPVQSNYTQKSWEQWNWVCEYMNWRCEIREWIEVTRSWWTTSCSDSTTFGIEDLDCPAADAFKCCTGEQKCLNDAFNCEICRCENGKFRDIGRLRSFWKKDQQKFAQMMMKYKEFSSVCETSSVCDGDGTDGTNGNGSTNTTADPMA